MIFYILWNENCTFDDDIRRMHMVRQQNTKKPSVSFQYIHVVSQKTFVNFECLANSSRIDFDTIGIFDNIINENKFPINETNSKCYATNIVQLNPQSYSLLYIRGHILCKT